jgi:D-alanyl-D-alanine carboxypeptidase/D-alanyl-D-alanine-endopeptidase (penicillin-binding protein 4)
MRRTCGHRWQKLGVLLVLAMAAAACSESGQGSSADTTTGSVEATIGNLPEDAKAIMERDEYGAARWSYLVVDPSTGEELYGSATDEFFFLASIAKEFTVGAVYEVLDPGATITTPVYATAEPVGGVLDGDLVLVAQGDLALGARNADEGRFDFTPDAPDHVYADALPGAQLLEGNDPLAGLDDLAGQVVDAGITEISGDVVIDDGLWEVFEAQEGLVPPIFVNDNLLDIVLTPGDPGEPATVATLPETAALTVTSEVVTGDPDSDAELEVGIDEADERVVRVSGTVPPGDPSLTVYRIPDGASWARTLFIEALERSGVTVSAPPLAANDTSALPEADAFPEGSEVASLTSAPISEMGGMILATSYNTGANAFLCLLAVQAGSTDCTDGLDAVRDLAVEAGIPDSELVLVDGQGGNPAAATPRAVIAWLEYLQSQEWGQVFEDGLPILGERGSLVLSGVGSPAAGKVKGKTGTEAGGEPGTGRLFIGVQGLAGYLDVGADRSLLFVVAVSYGVFPDVANGIFQVNDDVADVAGAFQQAQER